MRQDRISWLNKVRPNCYNLDHLFGFWREWDVMLAVRQMKHPDVICLPAVVLFLGENIMIHMFGERERSDPSNLRTVAYEYKYSIAEGAAEFISAQEVLFQGKERPEYGDVEEFDWGLFANDIFSMRFAGELWYYQNTTWDEIMAMGFPEEPALKWLEYFTDAGDRIPMSLSSEVFEEIVRKRLRKRGFSEEEIQTMGDEIDIDGHVSDDTCNMMTVSDEVRDAIEKLSEVPGLERREYVVGTLMNPDEFENQAKS